MKHKTRRGNPNQHTAFMYGAYDDNRFLEEREVVVPPLVALRRALSIRLKVLVEEISRLTKLQNTMDMPKEEVDDVLADARQEAMIIRGRLIHAKRWCALNHAGEG